MNEAPTFAHFNFHTDEDIGFGVFDAPSATNHPEYAPGMASVAAAYGDAFSLHLPPTPSGHISSQAAPFTFLPQTFVAPYHDPSQPSTPYLQPPAKFESPSLSSGSSSTPETRESQQLVTPKNMPTMSRLEGHDMIGEEDEDEDDEEDPHLRLPGARRRKPMGVSHNNHNNNNNRPKAKEDLLDNNNKYPGEGQQQQQQQQQRDSGGNSNNKRRHFLQRNRVAAMKCRKKKKEWVNDLEETKTGLESQNAHLHMELDGLVDEASRIRAELMVHASCNDANIDKWIENEAKRFVIGTSERYDQILALATGGSGNDRPEAGMSAPSGPPSAEYNPNNNNGNNAGENSNAAAAAGPSLVSPLDTTTPHQIPMLPSSPVFYTPTAVGMTTPGCSYVAGPSQETTPFGHGSLDHTPVTAGAAVADDEPDYDGMSMSLYDR